MMNNYYTYIHYKPDFTPFYVGKGAPRRANSLNSERNPYYLATVEKYGAENILVEKFECASEANAFELEMFVIKSLKEKGIKLTNFTDGGEGSSGYVHSLEVKLKMKERLPWNKGKTGMYSQEYKKKLSDAKKGKILSIEHKARISLGLIGNTWNNGKTLSTETRQKISDANKGKTRSLETKAKISAASKERTHSEESKAKMSISHKGK